MIISIDSKSAIIDIRKRQDVILEIEMQGARQ